MAAVRHGTGGDPGAVFDRPSVRPPTDVIAITSLPWAWVLSGLGKWQVTRDNRSMTLPDRKIPGHHRPTWVSGCDPVFISICGPTRGINQFAREPQWTSLVKAASHLRHHGVWQPLLLLAMPDHVHLIAIIPKSEGIGQAIRKFKRAASYGGQIRWQPAAFDHRIRSYDSYREKWGYVMANPERGGLTKAGEAWPYVTTWTLNAPR